MKVPQEYVKPLHRLMGLKDGLVAFVKKDGKLTEIQVDDAMAGGLKENCKTPKINLYKDRN